MASHFMEPFPVQPHLDHVKIDLPPGYPLHVLTGDDKADPLVGGNCPGVVSKDLQADGIESELLKCLLRHQSRCLGPVSLAPGLFFADHDPEECGVALPVSPPVGQRGRPNQALGLTLVNRETDAAGRGGQNERIEVGLGLRGRKRLEIVAQ